MIIAGEASGDNHAAKLINELAGGNFKFFGIGGYAMEQAGADIIFSSRELAVVGIAELVTKYPVLKKAFNVARDMLIKRRPDLLILVDFQEFNLKLAKYARKHDIKTLFYIGPQLWAWRPGRVKKIARRVDHMAVIFPFEVEFYNKHKVAVTFVGHPLAGKVKPRFEPDEAATEIGLAAGKKRIVLLPGSRMSEISCLLPVFTHMVKLLSADKNLQFAVSRADSLPLEADKQFAGIASKGAKIITGALYDLITAADVVVCASGTATLETAMLRKPMIVVAKTSPLTFSIARRLINMPFISLPNIIAGREVVPELIQNEVTADNIIGRLKKMLGSDNSDNKKMLTGLQEVKTRLETLNRDNILSDLVVQMLNE